MTRWIAMSVCLLSLFGCAKQQRISADPLGAAPVDFGVELTVLTGTNVDETTAQLRQSRYVMFPDGTLCAGSDDQRKHGADWLPPQTRVLTRRQVADVWSLAQQLGFTDPEISPGAINFRLVQPEPDQVVYLVTFRGWGDRWSLVRRDSAHEPDPAMVQLVREFASLSWATDRPPTAVSIAPKRYNFGPDPYARFLQPGGAPAAEVPTGERP